MTDDNYRIRLVDLSKPVERWTARRKQQLIEAYNAGTLSAVDILRVHSISDEELAEWLRRNGTGGHEGRSRLRALDVPAINNRPFTDRRAPQYRAKKRGRSGIASPPAADD